MTGPRIFVSIAAYRDPECQWTVRDLFRKAEHPERVFVGICWQLNAAIDWSCTLIKSNPAQVREKTFDARGSRGLCWARCESLAMREGEELVLSIDSHMRFHPRWDSDLLSMLESCPSKKPVLSVYPPRYEPPAELDCAVPRMRYEGRNPRGLPKFGGQELDEDEVPSAPMPSPFLAGGFMFARSALFDEVPYDPDILFTGDEMSYTVRAWTSGWDPFSPNRCIIHHFYYRVGYPMFDHDNRENFDRFEERGLARARRLLGLQDPDSKMARAEDWEREFGLGRARSLEQYYQYAGITPVTETP